MSYAAFWTMRDSSSESGLDTLGPSPEVTRQVRQSEEDQCSHSVSCLLSHPPACPRFMCGLLMSTQLHLHEKWGPHLGSFTLLGLNCAGSCFSWSGRHQHCWWPAPHGTGTDAMRRRRHCQVALAPAIGLSQSPQDKLDAGGCLSKRRSRRRCWRPTPPGAGASKWAPEVTPGPTLSDVSEADPLSRAPMKSREPWRPRPSRSGQ